MTALALWPEEIEALRPPEDLTVSEWAEHYRLVDRSISDTAGPWRNDVIPYLRGIMDSWTDEECERISVMKSVQGGGSEVMYNCIAFAVDQDPGPIMVVMPRNVDCDVVSAERLQPIFKRGSARLQSRVAPGARSMTMRELHFDRCSLHFAAAEAPRDLRNRPIRYLLRDEIDGYPSFSGAEGDPMALSEGRTTRFWNRKIMDVSSPTTRGGGIAKAYEDSDQRRYWVPCPRCGHRQILVIDQLRIPDREDLTPEDVIRDGLGRYECVGCKAQLEHADRRRMVENGVWAQKDATVLPGGEVRGAYPSAHHGFHFSALISTAANQTWSHIAAEQLKVERSNDPAQRMAFVNQRLGLPFEEEGAVTTVDALRRLAQDYEEGTLPEGARIITAGVDVQKDHFWYVVRAWGVDMQSWALTAGRCETWNALIDLVLRATWGGQCAQLVAIDTGYNTWDVYEFCLHWPDVCRAIKGASYTDARLPYRASNVPRHPTTGKPMEGLKKWEIDTQLFKDRINRLQTQEAPGWHLFKDPPREYLQQLAAEHKVLDRFGREGKVRWVWKQKNTGAPNHLWDCEVYATAAAQMLGLHALKSDLKPPKPSAEQRQRERQRPAGRRFTRRPGRWRR